MKNKLKEMEEIDPDKVQIDRISLSIALEQLDMVRLVLFRELERLDTRVVDRGTDSIESWHNRNNDENAYGGWPARAQNLLAAFEQIWELSEFLAKKSDESVLSLDEIKKKSYWLLVKEENEG